MATDIISQLGAGAGINSRQVIDELVAAQRTAQTTPLNDRRAVLNSRVDALGQLRDALGAIAGSLQERVRSGAFGLQPRASDTAVAVERSGLGPQAAFEASLVVEQLAAGQRLVAAPVATLDTPVGQGSLNFVFGRRTDLGGGDFSFAAGGAEADFSVVIGPGNNTLAGMRDAINAASGGAVTASIVNAGNGFSLVLRGKEGAARGFVVSAAEDVDAPGLSGFAYTSGNRALGFSAAAADAVMIYDGVTVSRDTNVVDGLADGVRLRLQRTTGPEGLALGANRDRAALASTLADFADTLGAMRGLIGDFRRGAANGEPAGPLAADSTARSMDQALAALVSAPVAAAGGLRLRDLGVEVTREGAVRFDAARFAQITPEQEAQAETLLAALSGNGRGQGLVALQAIGGLATPATEGLDRQRRSVDEALARAETRLEAYRTQLVRQFAAMDVLVASSKAVGTQLTQLVDSWYSRGQ
ncbi:flagellar hook-associated protein 2 [Polymorphobacter multimanifer]|uniref:Flagellar hook-associated protein 2 n=1 Tax=Polymorphobacter multimanifer TaxID=1070431 RepID=A0A841L4E4_9SPHN|nr:flagellar filament capping protein FliD [Polymorphobacter multimanifer]MBB6226331.1 flagellar hook-associated protein 2 [Polymorphobacter multimanifer]